jgi:hypothetical protein
MLRMGMRRSLSLAVASAALVACNVYDESLLGTGGASSGGAGPTTSDTSTSTGTSACQTAEDCPGMDTACGTRTCDAGVCGVNPAPMGTEVGDTTPHDCKKTVCDGAGDATDAPNPSDPPDDDQACTDDTCNGDMPKFTPKADGAPCSMSGGHFCLAGGCVECIMNSQCASGVCTMQHTCAPATCMDNTQNGDESDKDCGGSCSKCLDGQHCDGPDDCVSNSCSGTICQPSCTDMQLNQDETDTDCGGASCPACPFGSTCMTPSDCVTGNCMGGTCGPYQIVISEVRTRGPMGGNDDYVELYNPLSVPVTLTSDIEIDARSDAGATYGARWNGAGEVMPPHSHFLIGGTSYSDAVAADASLSSGITDKASVVLKQGATVIDALCFWCGTTSPFDASYTCEGTPFVKASCSSTTNYTSAERLPGGPGGNGTDTNDNTADFMQSNPSNPQDLAAPPVP